MRDIVAFGEKVLDPDWGEGIAASPHWNSLVREYGPSHFDNRSNRTLPRGPSTPPRARNADSDTLIETLNGSWSPPVPGFNQEEYIESDVDDDCLVDHAAEMREHTTDFY